MNRNTYPYLLKGVMMAIFTFILEYLLFAFISDPILLTLLIVIVLLITNHVLLEVTLRYKACLMSSIILLLVFGGFTYLVMANEVINGIPYSFTLWFIVALNWLVPYVYCFIRQYLDRGPRFPDYNKFFIGMTILFFIPFTIFLIYINYINPNFFNIYQPKDLSLIPFYMSATYIENILNDTVKASSFITYIALCLLLFIPIGYHVRLLTRDFSLALRILIFIIFCVLVEVLKIPILDTMNIDNILYSLMGMLIGGGLFAFVDYKHYQKKDLEYLYKSSFRFTYRY